MSLASGLSIRLGHLNLDGPLPIAIGTLHDPGCDGSEINLIEIEDVATLWANVNAFPIHVLHRIVGGELMRLLGAMGTTYERKRRRAQMIAQAIEATLMCGAYLGAAKQQRTVRIADARNM